MPIRRNISARQQAKWIAIATSLTSSGVMFCFLLLAERTLCSTGRSERFFRFRQGQNQAPPFTSFMKRVKRFAVLQGKWDAKVEIHLVAIVLLPFARLQ